ncbi:MAG: flavin reductase [Sphingobacteriales bacterium 17-39-43]|uniref:flavin reductase family protein n=1 Tax=Daejeonella sp. TaxID=2805397 RepID=UPI000BDC4D03|nr:flavin reductase [Daejeonella sp.]OYZ31169.1 MAG: flavin reductase [Sphingobacteriales bacterium 16-39-50]OZA24048.1 MAG: flavin reductase [Sphingobacteriales bacterium 17-39-43]HQT23218.1 flavin reductase [Daejeonella sp.]HQT58170.1 flavin reductase [Daejeonella sp.]
MNFNQSHISAMEKRYRTTFINSLPGYRSLHMLGTVNKEGISNLGLFNSVFHIGANPPFLGMVFRPDGNDHDSLDNIIQTKEYTLNNVLPEWFKQAHQTSARFPSGLSEFEPCGFKEFYLDPFKAPFVEQASIKIGLELREIIDVSLNNSKILIGEIVHVLMDDGIVASDGYVDHIKAGTVTVSGLDSYFTTEHLGRLAYAKFV